MISTTPLDTATNTTNTGTPTLPNHHTTETKHHQQSSFSARLSNRGRRKLSDAAMPIAKVKATYLANHSAQVLIYSCLIWQYFTHNEFGLSLNVFGGVFPADRATSRRANKETTRRANGHAINKHADMHVSKNTGKHASYRGEQRRRADQANRASERAKKGRKTKQKHRQATEQATQ